MKILFLAAVLILLGSPAPGFAQKPPARFLALGDSYTIGEGLVPAQRWPVQLAARLRERGVAVAEPVIIARTGWTAADLSDAVEEARPRGPFDLVTLQIGVNDQYQGEDPGQYRPRFAALLRRAVTLAGGRPERVVVLSIPDWSVTPFAAETGRDRARTSGEIERFNRVDREETQRAGARWVDVTLFSRESRGGSLPPGARRPPPLGHPIRGVGGARPPRRPGGPGPAGQLAVDTSKPPSLSGCAIPGTWAVTV